MTVIFSSQGQKMEICLRILPMVIFGARIQLVSKRNMAMRQRLSEEQRGKREIVWVWYGERRCLGKENLVEEGL